MLTFVKQINKLVNVYNKETVVTIFNSRQVPNAHQSQTMSRHTCTCITTTSSIKSNSELCYRLIAVHDIISVLQFWCV